MRSLVAFCLLIAFVVLVFVPPSGAQPPRGAVRGVSQRLDRLIQDLDTAEQQAQEILSQQDQTIAEIKNVKIWARR